jgi:hypothetical protein
MELKRKNSKKNSSELNNSNMKTIDSKVKNMTKAITE